MGKRLFCFSLCFYCTLIIIFLLNNLLLCLSFHNKTRSATTTIIQTTTNQVKDRSRLLIDGVQHRRLLGLHDLPALALLRHRQAGVDACQSLNLFVL